jgi:malate dehydrogenase (oxaloacetate-decarboxylating)(NADP+)
MAQEEVSDEVAMAYPGEELSFGPEYLIPKPFDPRLIIDHRAGRGPGGDEFRRRDPADHRPGCLPGKAAGSSSTGPASACVRSFSAAKRGRRTKRIVYPDGEEERMLRAAQIHSSMKV